MTSDKKGIGLLVLAVAALWFFGRKSAEAVELARIEAQLPTATGEEEVALLARKAELESILAERAFAAEQAKVGIPPSVSVPGLFAARVDQLYQEKIAGIPTSWAGVSPELEQLFYQDALASAKLAAVREAEREISGDIHIVYDSKAVAKAAAENQLVDYQRQYQEGLDALASQGLLGKYYEGAGSGGWFDKLRTLESRIPEQEATVASPLTVREEQALAAGAQVALEAEVAALEAKVTASEVVKTVEQENAVPEGFTASKDQLDQLVSAGVSRDSPTYKEAVDYSYTKTASETKPGETVAWSSDRGYYNMSESEISSYNIPGDATPAAPEEEAVQSKYFVGDAPQAVAWSKYH